MSTPHPMGGTKHYHLYTAFKKPDFLILNDRGFGCFSTVPEISDLWIHDDVDDPESSGIVGDKSGK